ncbi:MAG: PadR family transcriptional regulator [Spirochaetia bacterium]
MDKELVQNLLQELKRGSLTLAVLLVTRKAVYGYSLVQELQEEGLDVEQNTLYPLLRRMESQGLLQSTWDTTESRPRKYYSVTPEGEEMASRLGGEWKSLDRIISGLIENKKKKER